MILIVEDDLDIADAMRDALEHEGHAVRLAANGRDALEAVRAEHVDLILLDWMMPVMDGEAFLAAQRRLPAVAAIPTVVVTADLRLQERVRELGVAGFLRKPIALDKLFETVASFVRPKR